MNLEGRLAFHSDLFRWPSKGMLALELVLAAMLAVQGVRLFWLLVTPAGAFGTPVTPVPPAAKADLSVLARFDPFHRGQAEGAAALPVEGFKLFGIRMGADGRGGAILGGPDGRQDSYSVGERVAPGIVLAAVGRDHVVLARGGMRMRVAFPAPAPGAYVPAPAPATPAPADDGGTIIPKAFLSGTNFQPRIQDGQVLGYQVTPQDGGQAFAAAGLQAGDVIRAINGAPLGAHRFGEIESEFGGSQVELTIERGGQTFVRKLQVAK